MKIEWIACKDEMPPIIKRSSPIYWIVCEELGVTLGEHFRDGWEAWSGDMVQVTHWAIAEDWWPEPPEGLGD